MAPSSRRIHRSTGVRLMSARSGSRWTKLRRQRTTCSRSACHSPGLTGTPYSCSKRPARFGLSRYTPSREPFHSCRIWRTVSSISEASDSAWPSRRRQQRALDGLVDDAARPHLPGAELLQHVERAHGRVGAGIPAAPGAVVVQVVAPAALLEDVVARAGPRKLVGEVGHGPQHSRPASQSGRD